MQLQILKPLEFADYLIERGALSEEQLLDALAEQWQGRIQLAASIVRRGYLSQEEVERFHSEFENLKVVYV